MIEDPPILRIKRATRRPTEAQIAAFRDVPTSFVVDAMYGGGALASFIRPIGEGRDLVCRAVGPALTADNGPGDVLATHAALDMIQPGDIVVATSHGYQGCAAAGDSIMGMASNSGAAGFVTDGPVRDYQGIVRAGLPVWCTGLTPASPFMSAPGRVGYPVQIAGQAVDAGDLIVADFDGVVVVPFDRIDGVIDMLKVVGKSEAERDAAVENGLKIPAKIKDLLASQRVHYED